jgi:hypothetical protein
VAQTSSARHGKISVVYTYCLLILTTGKCDVGIGSFLYVVTQIPGSVMSAPIAYSTALASYGTNVKAGLVFFLKKALVQKNPITGKSPRAPLSYSPRSYSDSLIHNTSYINTSITLVGIGPIV